MIMNEEKTNANERTILCNTSMVEIISTYEFIRNVNTKVGKVDIICLRRQITTNVYHTVNKTILSKPEINRKTKTQIHNRTEIFERYKVQMD